MNQEILDKGKKLIELTDNKICNHCLGRKFSSLVEGNGNVDRGLKIRKLLNIDDYNPENRCYICDNLFLKINDNLIEKIEDKIEFLQVEFDNFLVGTKVNKDLLERDQEIDEKLNFDVENIKKEINREIGKTLELKFEKNAEFEKNDIVIMVDFRKEDIKVRIQINPIFIEGKYNKFKRGIPQTKWPCRKCKGKGCEYCNFTGKMYNESVEELLSETVLKYSNGRSCKFHGAGREDIDVLMLGEGRTFVLEVIEPKTRHLDLEKIENEANTLSEGKTKYNDLKFTYKNRKAEIKVSSPDTFKTYTAIVKCGEKYSSEKLEDLKTLKTIKQRTPIRVSHRRADKIREKNVIDLETKIIDERTFEMTVKTQGGLYIKELISGDEERTQPNVSKILEVPCLCEQLDVVNLSEK